MGSAPQAGRTQHILDGIPGIALHLSISGPVFHLSANVLLAKPISKHLTHSGFDDCQTPLLCYPWRNRSRHQTKLCWSRLVKIDHFYLRQSSSQ
jgi:hypothetical protein